MSNAPGPGTEGARDAAKRRGKITTRLRPRTTGSPRFLWIDAIRRSGLPSTTRYVLFGLSFHMTADGENCRVSQETLGAELNLSVRAVREHIALAERKKWLIVHRYGYGRGGRFANEYIARFPQFPDNRDLDDLAFHDHLATRQEVPR